MHKMNVGFGVIIALSVFVGLAISETGCVSAQKMDLFYLTISPHDFTINSGESKEITAYLQSRGPRGNLYPEPDRRIEFSASVGTIQPDDEFTNQDGEASVRYFAPEVREKSHGGITAKCTLGGKLYTARSTVHVEPGFFLIPKLNVPWYIIVELIVLIGIVIVVIKLYLF